MLCLNAGWGGIIFHDTKVEADFATEHALFFNHKEVLSMIEVEGI